MTIRMWTVSGEIRVEEGVDHRWPVRCFFDASAALDFCVRLKVMIAPRLWFGSGMHVDRLKVCLQQSNPALLELDPKLEATIASIIGLNRWNRFTRGVLYFVEETVLESNAPDEDIEAAAVAVLSKGVDGPLIDQFLQRRECQDPFAGYDPQTATREDYLAVRGKLEDILSVARDAYDSAWARLGDTCPHNIVYASGLRSSLYGEGRRRPQCGICGDVVGYEYTPDPRVYIQQEGHFQFDGRPHLNKYVRMKPKE